MLLPAAFASAARSVVGGSTIEVQSAPWAVFIQNRGSSEYYDCSGSVIDALHVLTAAHCVFDSSGTLAQPSQLSVTAGVSDSVTPLSTDASQLRTVSSFTVHPGYSYSTTPGPDDIAVIALASPLDLSGSAVKAVALPAAASAYPAGAEVTLAGFGEESSGATPSGQLNSMSGSVDAPGSCGGDDGIDDDAVRFCAASPSSSTCEGDSGGGLVTTGSSPTLIGVLSAGAPGCPVGSDSVFTYLKAPEILDFVQGNQQPPTAPRELPSTFVHVTWYAPLEVGAAISCTSGGWSVTPTSTAYAFVDAANGQVLQQGSSGTFVPSTADVGDRIQCTALATNAGGTAAVITTATPAVKSAPARRRACPRRRRRPPRAPPRPHRRRPPRAAPAARRTPRRSRPRPTRSPHRHCRARATGRRCRSGTPT